MLRMSRKNNVPDWAKEGYKSAQHRKKVQKEKADRVKADREFAGRPSASDEIVVGVREEVDKLSDQNTIVYKLSKVRPDQIEDKVIFLSASERIFYPTMAVTTICNLYNGKVVEY